jgi:hypothetical protein
MKPKSFYATILLLGTLSSLNAEDFTLKEAIKSMKLQYQMYGKYDYNIKRGKTLNIEFDKVIDKAEKLRNKMKKDKKWSHN